MLASPGLCSISEASELAPRLKQRRSSMGGRPCGGGAFAAAPGKAAAAAAGAECGCAPGAHAVTPIMVTCGGISDDSELSRGRGSADGSDSDGGQLSSACSLLPVEVQPLQPSSSSSSRDECGGTPAVFIRPEDMAAGRYKTGVRYYMETHPSNLLLRVLDAGLAMSSMFGYTATLVLIPLLAWLAWAASSWVVGTFITFIVLSVFLPAEPLLWGAFQRSTLVSSWRRYFRFSIIVDAKLDQDGRYIFAGFPHGVFPVSELLCISLMLRAWPRLRVYSIAASSVFKVPVWRHIMCWTGARPATAAQFRALLARGSVSLVPGGIAEMFLWEPGREVVKVRDRKGFVRLAVEAGVPLVPVFHFGNSQLFSWVAPRSWEVIARRLRMAVGYPQGRWGTLLPRNAPLMMAVGSPIPVPRIARGAPGYDDAVDGAHAALVEALEALYHKYKGQYGWDSRPLVVTLHVMHGGCKPTFRET